MKNVTKSCNSFCNPSSIMFRWVASSSFNNILILALTIAKRSPYIHTIKTLFVCKYFYVWSILSYFLSGQILATMLDDFCTIYKNIFSSGIFSQLIFSRIFQLNWLVTGRRLLRRSAVWTFPRRDSLLCTARREAPWPPSVIIGMK